MSLLQQLRSMLHEVETMHFYSKFFIKAVESYSVFIKVIN